MPLNAPTCRIDDRHKGNATVPAMMIRDVADLQGEGRYVDNREARVC